MKLKNQTFRGQLANEEVIAFYRRHWIVLLHDFLAFGVYVAVIALFFVNISNFALPSLTETYFQALVVMGVLAMGLAIHRFFLRLMAHAMNLIIVTNLRIVLIRKTLILHNDYESIYFRNIQDIHKQQNGFFQNLCGFGEIIITSVGSDPVCLSTVPYPDHYVSVMNRVRMETFSPSHPAVGQNLSDRRHRPMKDTSFSGDSAPESMSSSSQDKVRRDVV